MHTQTTSILDSKLEQKGISNHPNTEVYGVLFLDWDHTVVHKGNDGEDHFLDKKKIKEIFKTAQEQNFHIRIVTARPNDPEEIKEIAGKLKELGITFDKKFIHCVVGNMDYGYLTDQQKAVRKKNCIRKLLNEEYKYLNGIEKKRCCFVDDSLHNINEVEKIIPSILADSEQSHFPKILRFLNQKREKDLTSQLFDKLKQCLNLLSPTKNSLKSVPEGIKEIQKLFNSKTETLDKICQIAQARKKKTHLEWSICPLFCRRDPLLGELYQLLVEANQSIKKLEDAVKGLDVLLTKIETRKQNIKSKTAAEAVATLHAEKSFMRNPFRVGF